MIAAPAPHHPPAYLRWVILAGLALSFLTLGLIPEVREFLHRAYAALTSTDPAITHAFVDGLGWAGLAVVLVGLGVNALSMNTRSIPAVAAEAPAGAG